MMIIRSVDKIYVNNVVCKDLDDVSLATTDCSVFVVRFFFSYIFLFGCYCCAQDSSTFRKQISNRFVSASSCLRNFRKWYTKKAYKHKNKKNAIHSLPVVYLCIVAKLQIMKNVCSSSFVALYSWEERFVSPVESIHTKSRNAMFGKKAKVKRKYLFNIVYSGLFAWGLIRILAFVLLCAKTKRVNQNRSEAEAYNNLEMGFTLLIETFCWINPMTPLVTINWPFLD